MASQFVLNALSTACVGEDENSKKPRQIAKEGRKAGIDVVCIKMTPAFLLSLETCLVRLPPRLPRRRGTQQNR
jgi:hypothetical protein